MKVSSSSVGSTTPEIILKDGMVVTMDDERTVYESGYVWVKNGAIHRVGDSAEITEVPEGVDIRSAKGCVVMPGLVNCHSHFSNGILRGIYDEMPLAIWFSKGMWPVMEAMDRPTGKAGAELALLEQMTIGVTTSVSGEFGTPNRDTIDGVLEAVHQSRMRAIVSRMTIDSADESSATQAVPKQYREKPEYAANEVRRLQKAFNSDRVSVAPEALGVLRCTAEMVQAMHEVSVNTGSPFLMHVASSKEEREESHRRLGHGSVAEMHRLGVLGPRTLIAHAIWLDDAEIGHLAEHQTGVSHNPVANAYYASGFARLAELLEAGVPVGLGVDGASTNNGQNVWETMKMALLFQKERLNNASFGSAELALELMTRGGAKALHMEDQIGSLEPGKRADFIVIDTERVALAPAHTVISNLVYSNDPGAVRDVYIDGEHVVASGVHKYLNKADVIDRARMAQGRVLERTELTSYLASRSKWKWKRAGSR